MTGLRGGTHTQPLEKRKARGSGEADRGRSNCGEERAAILLLYAWKIAAAELFSAPEQRAAIIAVLRAEENAALQALRERKAAEEARMRKRRHRVSEFRMIARVVFCRASLRVPNRVHRHPRIVDGLRRQVIPRNS